MGRTPSVAKDACVEAEFHLDWTPAPTQGGFNETVCLEATSANPGTCTDTTPAPRVHCIRLVVHRCRYVLQQDQQLQEVAALFNVDWMRLWSLNPELVYSLLVAQSLPSPRHRHRIPPPPPPPQPSLLCGDGSQTCSP